MYRRHQAEEKNVPPPARVLDTEEKAEAIREKAKRVHSSFCLVLNQLTETGKGIAPIIELGFDAPGGILKKAITKLKETASILGEDQKIEAFEGKMREIQNDWVSGKPVDVDAAYALVRQLQRSINTEAKDDELGMAAEKLAQQLAALPAKIDQEIERLERNTRKCASDRASTEVYQKLVEAADDNWRTELPYPSDNPGELKTREEEESNLGKQEACQNAIARLVKRNDENIAFNYVNSLACTISREKDKTGRIVFKVKYVNDNPKNVEQAMEKMILRCHELNPSSEILLSCTLLKDIYGDPKKYMEMRLKELEGVVKTAEKAKAEGKYIAIVLDASIKELLDQMPENPKLIARISDLHQEWETKVKKTQAEKEVQATARYSYKESEIYKKPQGDNISSDQLKEIVNKYENEYKQLDVVDRSIEESLTDLEKKVEECKKDKDGLEKCLAMLMNLESVQKETYKKFQTLSENMEGICPHLSPKIIQSIPQAQPKVGRVLARRLDKDKMEEQRSKIKELRSKADEYHKESLLQPLRQSKP